MPKQGVTKGRSARLAAGAGLLSIACGAPDSFADLAVPHDAPSQPAMHAQDPYAGVVTDATITSVGHDFYREFTSAWRERVGIEQFSLAVVERPSARWGSLVWVKYRNRQVFRVFLSPARRDDVRRAGREAAGVVYRNVVQTEVDRMLFRDPDLARDGF